MAIIPSHSHLEMIMKITRDSIMTILKEARAEMGLGVSVFETLAGVPRDTLRDFERGKCQIMRPDRLQRLLNFIGYDLTITKLTSDQRIKIMGHSVPDGEAIMNLRNCGARITADIKSKNSLSSKALAG